MVILHSDWRKIVRRAWSMKFTAVAGLFSGAVMLAPWLAPRLPLGWLAAFALVANIGAGITRLLSQHEFRENAK